MIQGYKEATSIPWTSRSSKPALLADSESKCRGFESWLTLEYSKTSSLVYTLFPLKTSPILRTRGGSKLENILTKWDFLLISEFLASILSRYGCQTLLVWHFIEHVPCKNRTKEKEIQHQSENVKKWNKFTIYNNLTPLWNRLFS